MANSEEPQDRRILYRKKKDINIFLLPSGKHFQVEAEMDDGVHRLKLNMVVRNPSLRIDEIRCEMPGVPDTICREAVNCLDSLLGRRVEHGLVQELNGDWVLNGCTHLKNLFFEACYSLPQAQLAMAEQDLSARFPGLSEAQLYKIIFWFRPEFQNSCIRYTEKAPFMQEVVRSSVPEGAEKLQAVAAAMRK